MLAEGTKTILPRSAAMVVLDYRHLMVILVFQQIMVDLAAVLEQADGSQVVVAVVPMLLKDPTLAHMVVVLVEPLLLLLPELEVMLLRTLDLVVVDQVPMLGLIHQQTVQVERVDLVL